jgi:hypothetical protein
MDESTVLGLRLIGLIHSKSSEHRVPVGKLCPSINLDKSHTGIQKGLYRLSSGTFSNQSGISFVHFVDTVLQGHTLCD